MAASGGLAARGSRAKGRVVRVVAGHVWGSYLSTRDLQTVAQALTGLAVRAQPGQLPRMPVAPRRLDIRAGARLLMSLLGIVSEVWRNE